MAALSIVFTLGCLLGLWQLPAIWSHRTSYYDTPPSWWPHGEAAWRGWVRGLPAALVGATLGGIACIVAGFTGVFETEALTDTASRTVFALLMACLLMAVLSALALALNRPKWVVPPHLRNGPGLIAEWRRARDV